MPCRWTSRKNLRDYCSCCSYGTRLGCMVNERPEGESYTTSLRNADLPTGQQEIRIGKFVIKKSGRPIRDVSEKRSSTPKTREEIAREEMTCNPIFLVKRYWYSCPDGCKHEGEESPDGTGIVEDTEYPCDCRSRECPFNDAYEREGSRREHDVAVFFTREAGLAYGRSQTHNLGKEGDGWTVLCLPAVGVLAKILVDAEAQS